MDLHTADRPIKNSTQSVSSDQTMSTGDVVTALGQSSVPSTTCAPVRRPVWLPDDIHILIIEHAGTSPEPNSHESFQQPMADSYVREAPEYALYRDIVGALAFLASAALVSKTWSSVAVPLLYRRLLPAKDNGHPLMDTLRAHAHLRGIVRDVSTRACPGASRLLVPAGPWPALVRVDTVVVNEALVQLGRDALVEGFPHLETLTLSVRIHGVAFDLALPPSLQSLAVHADWDSDLTFLHTNSLSNLASLSLHICFFDELPAEVLSLRNLVTRAAGFRLTCLRLSLWTAEVWDVNKITGHAGDLLERCPMLETLSINGVDLDTTLERCRLESLETLEILHAYAATDSRPVLVGPPSAVEEAGEDNRSRLLRQEDVVSFGHQLEDVNATQPTAISIPQSLVDHLDRPRLPLLRTLAVKSLDFSLATHRTGRLVLGHVARLRKIGIRIVDRHEVEFGQERAGWEWGKVAEEKEEGVQTAAVED